MQGTIEAPALRPWRSEATFHEELSDWMGRAPWLAVSAAAHLLVFFVLMAIPWDALRRAEPVVLTARVESPPEPEVVPVEEPPPQPVEVQDEPVPVEPRLIETDDLPMSVEDELDADATSGEPDQLAAAAFADASTWNDVLGLGGPGLSGKYGVRGSGGPKGRGSDAYDQGVARGLAWLAAHQSEDGAWDGDAFHERCGRIGSTVCDGAGYATHDVGLTGLALLAFLGVGSTSSGGEHRDVVSRGLAWLKDAQEESGQIGPRASREFLYDHAIATLALCENHYLTKSPVYRDAAQRAVFFLQSARDPYGAWRYDAPSVGDADTSVTGWALFALCAARDAGLVVDQGALDGGLAFLDAMTDPATGRVGYTERGGLSSRTAANERYPRERGEAMTAVGLLCRIFLGATPEREPVLERHADLLRARPPAWDADGRGCDMYYWYYGTYAAYQIGGRTWKTWQAALGDAVAATQRRDGDASGSWDPVGPWGHVGGRVYSTAMLTLTLEVYHRYAPLLGAR